MICKNCGKEQPDDLNFCASCGTEKGALPKKKMSGCTLAAIICAACLVLVVPVVGITAAIAIPNLLNAIDRGKQKRTMADIRSIATGVESYQIQNGVYPQADNLDELRQLISPEFVVTLPLLDGWARPIEAIVTPEGYQLSSPGKDGVFDGCDAGAQMTFNADICFENGQFTQWPEGTQQ